MSIKNVGSTGVPSEPNHPGPITHSTGIKGGIVSGVTTNAVHYSPSLYHLVTNLDRWLDRLWKAALIAACVAMLVGAAAGCNATRSAGITEVTPIINDKPVDFAAEAAKLQAMGITKLEDIEAYLRQQQLRQEERLKGLAAQVTELTASAAHAAAGQFGMGPLVDMGIAALLGVLGLKGTQVAGPVVVRKTAQGIRAAMGGTKNFINGPKV